MYRKAMMVLCSLMLIPTLALAQAKPWVQVGGGFSTYTMGDVNDVIDFYNAGFTVLGLSEWDNVTKGFSFNGAFGVDVAPKIAVGVSFDRLMANADWSDATLGSLEFDMPANLFRGFGQYQFTKTPKSVFYVEAGVGMINSAAVYKETGVSDMKLEGSGVTFDGGVGAEFIAAPQVSIFGTAGYRKAEITEVKSDGVKVTDINDAPFTIDYSGVFIKAGLKFAFMK
jgi:hypothetical protein